MSKWVKLKKIQPVSKPLEIDENGIETEEEKHLYEIEQIPDPKYKLKVFKPLQYFQRNLYFQDAEDQSCQDILPCPELRKMFIMQQPYHKNVGSGTPMSHSDMNTTNKETTETGMNHQEGGWPEHVRKELAEHRSKFIRHTCKDDTFKWTINRLMNSMEKVFKQNNVMDIEELYFEDMEDSTEPSTLMTKTLARFKDFSGRRRPVSCLAWKNCKVRQTIPNFSKYKNIFY